MKKILDLISEEVMQVFEAAGYEKELGKVSISNRPDLCEYQCNGAMAGAKKYKKAPIMIANDVAAKLADSQVFEKVDAVAPGFLNFTLSREFVGNYVKEMRTFDKFGLEEAQTPLEMVIDYGGPNVAKPLHVGHLRSGVIGESIKRIVRYMGHHITGDIHLGDWGQPMGLIMNELHIRKPDLCILMRVIQENTRQSFHLPSQSWKKSIHLPASVPRKILSIRKIPWHVLINYRVA